jgi:hypothetical protein
MRILLSILILTLVIGHMFTLDMGLGPGLSVKNAVLYVAAVFITFRIVLGGNFKLEMGQFVACYLALIVYATVTWIVVGLFINYKGYNMLASGILLKNVLIDPLIFFLTFLFGIRTTEDAFKILTLLGLACVVLNTANLGAAFHLLPLDYIGQGGRMAGPMGEPNQYGDYIVIFLPLLCVAAVLSNGFVRLLWVVGIMVSMGSLLTTASRAAIVALIVSSIWGTYLARSYLSSRAIAKWFMIAIVISIVIGAVVSIEFADILSERFIGQSKSAGLGDFSSGRTDLWMGVVDKLMSQPIAMITGFGWNAFDNMGFFFSAHSYYLAQWFDLGILGLILGITSFALLIREARRVLPVAHGASRSYLIACVFSILALLVAVIFGELTTPMPYFWIYMGVCMRVAVNARVSAESAPKEAKPDLSPRGALLHAQ